MLVCIVYMRWLGHDARLGFTVFLMVSCFFLFAMFSFWAMYSMLHYGWNGVHGWCGMFSLISTYNNAQLEQIRFFFFMPMRSGLMVSSRSESQKQPTTRLKQESRRKPLHGRRPRFIALSTTPSPPPLPLPLLLLLPTHRYLNFTPGPIGSLLAPLLRPRRRRGNGRPRSRPRVGTAPAPIVRLMDIDEPPADCQWDGR